MRTMLLSTSAILALTACQKSPGASAPSASPSSSAGASMSGAPQRRAGLWQQTFIRDGSPLPMGSMKVCVDAASAAKASVFNQDMATKQMDKMHCSQRAASRGLDGSYSFSSTCPMPGGGATTTKGVASGDFSSGYHVHVESNVTGATYAAMNGHHVSNIDSKWLGPCPAGMAPGDMELSNGMKISGGKLAGAAAALAHGGQ